MLTIGRLQFSLSNFRIKSKLFDHFNARRNSKHEAVIQVQSNTLTGICKTKMQCCNYKAWIDETGDSTACLVEVKEKEASLSAV